MTSRALEYVLDRVVSLVSSQKSSYEKFSASFCTELDQPADRATFSGETVDRAGSVFVSCATFDEPAEHAVFFRKTRLSDWLEAYFAFLSDDLLLKAVFLRRCAPSTSDGGVTAHPCDDSTEQAAFSPRNPASQLGSNVSLSSRAMSNLRLIV